MCTYTHICDKHIHTYTHPYRQYYMCSHLGVCVYEFWCVYTCVSSHVCCVHALRMVQLHLFADVWSAYIRKLIVMYIYTHVHIFILQELPLTSVFIWIMVHLCVCLFGCILFTCIVCIKHVCFYRYMYDIDMYTHIHVHAHLWHTYARTHIHTDTLHEWPLMRVCAWIVVYVNMCLFACTLYTCIVYGTSVSTYRCVI